MEQTEIFRFEITAVDGTKLRGRSGGERWRDDLDW